MVYLSIDNVDLNYSINDFGNPERFSLVLGIASKIKKLESSVSELDAACSALKRRTKVLHWNKKSCKKSAVWLLSFG